MANKKEMLKIKKEQLMSKVVENPKDTSSLEAQIVALTVKIRSYEEHMQKHQKDKAHKRYLLMSIDKRQKMLKNLRKTNYPVFEKTCKELGIEYIFPPPYHRKIHRRLATKKALCIRVFQEVQKLKKQKRALKTAAAAAQKQGQRNPESPSEARGRSVETRPSTRWRRGSKAAWLRGEEASVQPPPSSCLKDEGPFTRREWGGRASQAGGIASAKTSVRACAALKRAAELDTQPDRGT